MPRPDFPRSIPEFYAKFPDEDAAFRFVSESRWPDGWRCPKCGHAKGYARVDRRGVECSGCGYVGSVTAGTVMHKSRMELRTWLLVTDKRGVSAKNLQRQLGIPRYETAFQMLHKLRAAMVAPERTKLIGAVEVDETMVGGVRTGRTRDPRDKFIVVGAIEIRVGERGKRNKGYYPGRVRFRHVKSRTEKALAGFVRDVVEEGALVITDGHASYGSLDLKGYEHGVESTAAGMAQGDVLRHFHLAASNLKAWLAGMFHGSVSGQHLQAYLNEFAFRFNRRNNLHAAFQTILGIGTNVAGPEYAMLYSREWVHPYPERKRRRA